MEYNADAIVFVDGNRGVQPPRAFPEQKLIFFGLEPDVTQDLMQGFEIGMSFSSNSHFPVTYANLLHEHGFPTTLPSDKNKTHEVSQKR